MQANIDNAMFYLELVQKRRAQPQDDLFTKLIEADLEREDGGLEKLEDLDIAAFASLSRRRGCRDGHQTGRQCGVRVRTEP